MAAATMGGFLGHLRQVIGDPARTDGELLARFVTDRDADAFAGLVRRHGPMVFGVCRRALPNEADAEDAFQATFLVLARKAHVVRPPGRVGYWLYGVARHTARKARTIDRRRQARERRAAELSPRPASPPDPRWEELDREIGRLPERYRTAVVLCDLQGDSLKDVARRLDCPVGTVASRLARGRDLLRRNLTRRGLAALLGPAVAAVPARLRAATAAAATGAGPVSSHVIAIAEGVFHAMLLSKLKVALVAVVAAGTLALGLGTGPGRVQADPPAEKAKPGEKAKPEEKAKVADPKTDKPAPVKPTKPGKPAPAEGTKKVAVAQGKVKGVDADKGNITVTTATKNGGTTDQTYPLAKDAKIFVDGHEGKLADLKPGYQVSLKLNEDKAAVGIGAEGPSLTGELKAVDADKHTVRVLVTTYPDPKDKTKTGTEEKTFPLTDKAQVSVQGVKKATLADLKAGASVQVRLTAEGDKVFSISSPVKKAEDGVKKPVKPGAPDKPAKPEKPTKPKVGN